ncbi:retron St85 family effector protein [Azorhizophilus paspali]|uniref:Retron St85 family effector protein n=1 Tax=Azorhizophilus paspali TaxID=69963 RepID=A0ABV6SL51_AZOPA
MDPRQSLIQDLDPIPSRVEFSQRPIVLLCGGHVPQKGHPDLQDPPIRSIRQRIVKSFPEYEIFRPEEIDNWHADGVFKNLIDFESDLASICSLVVIILESEGAIAELGAFSQLPDFNKKLVVIVSEGHADDISFINLGILRHLRGTHESAVKRYPWDVKRPADAEDQTISDIIDDVKLELDGLQKSQALKVTSEAHLIIIIYELTRLFVALREAEIIEAMKFLGCEIRRDNLRRKLFLLERLGFVKKIAYSDSGFYAAINPNFHNVRFALKSKSALNPTRIRLDTLRYYKETKEERNRVRAIERARIGEGV